MEKQELKNMEKQELNSLYGVRANKYIDTDSASVYSSFTTITLDTVCEKLTAKIHAVITFYLSWLDNDVEFALKYAIKEDNKEDSCFHHMALDVRTCYDEVIRNIYEISNLLIPFDLRCGEAYGHFMKELVKAKEISHKLFVAIDTIEDYKKFALEVRRGN